MTQHIPAREEWDDHPPDAPVYRGARPPGPHRMLRIVVRTTRQVWVDGAEVTEPLLPAQFRWYCTCNEVGPAKGSEAAARDDHLRHKFDIAPGEYE